MKRQKSMPWFVISIVTSGLFLAGACDRPDKKTSIYGLWRQQDASEGGLLGIQPKTNEVIVICKEHKMIAYGGDFLLLYRDINVSPDKIEIEGSRAPLLYQIRKDTLTISGGTGGKGIYRKLSGKAKVDFLAAHDFDVQKECTTD